MASTSDKNSRIGRIGEGWFDDLCNRADLLYSQPKPDRTGRDRIIEFPSDAIRTDAPLDRSNVPSSFYVQIKCTASIEKSVKISLSVMERLAKGRKPTFIVFVGLDECEQVSACYIAHVNGDLLAPTLKRLRSEEKKGVSFIRDQTMALNPTTFPGIELTPASLRARPETVEWLASG